MTDLLLAGGPVWTGDGARSRATAVLVRGGRVVAVGGDEVREQAGPRAEVVDLAGRLLVPGFQDAHVHPMWAGLEMLSCSLGGLSTRSSTSSGWRRTPASTPTSPGSGAAAGTCRCSRAGADPRGARRGGARPAGLPDGQRRPPGLGQQRGAAARRDRRAHPRPGRRADRARRGRPPDGRAARAGDGAGRRPRARRRRPSSAARRCSSRRPTCTGSASRPGRTPSSARTPAGPTRSTPTSRPAAAGTLTARVRGALWWDRTRGLEQVEDLVERRARHGRPLHAPARSRSCRTACRRTSPPRCRRRTSTSAAASTDRTGLSMVDPAVLTEAVVRLTAAGFAMHFHAIGDRALTEVLDAVEAALAAHGDRGLRHCVAHLQVVRPDDVPALPPARRRGQPAAAVGRARAADGRAVHPVPRRRAGGLAVPVRRPAARRARRSPAAATGRCRRPTRSRASRSRSTGGCRTRRPARRCSCPSSGSTSGTALAAYTAGSAHVNGLDDTGTIRVGALADLAVLDRDPFDGPRRGRLAHPRGVDVRRGGAGAPRARAVSFAQGLVRPDVSAEQARRGRPRAVRRRRRGRRARQPAGPQLPGRRLRAQGRPPVVHGRRARRAGRRAAAPRRHARASRCRCRSGPATAACVARSGGLRARLLTYVPGTPLADWDHLAPVVRRAARRGRRPGRRRASPTSSTPGSTGCCSGTCGRRARSCEQLAPHVPRARRDGRSSRAAGDGVRPARRARRRPAGAARARRRHRRQRRLRARRRRPGGADRRHRPRRRRPRLAGRRPRGHLRVGAAPRARPAAVACCRRCGRTPRRCR